MLSWKSQRDQIIPTLNASCYAFRVVKPFMSQDTLKMVHYSYIHTLMTCGIIF